MIASRAFLAVIWLEIRKINGWGSKIEKDGKTFTKVDYRPDIVTIEVEGITREAGKITVEPIYTKRLSERHFFSDKYASGIAKRVYRIIPPYDDPLIPLFFVFFLVLEIVRPTSV